MLNVFIAVIMEGLELPERVKLQQQVKNFNAMWREQSLETMLSEKREQAALQQLSSLWVARSLRESSGRFTLRRLPAEETRCPCRSLLTGLTTLSPTAASLQDELSLAQKRVVLRKLGFARCGADGAVVLREYVRGPSVLALPPLGARRSPLRSALTATPLVACRQLVVWCPCDDHGALTRLAMAALSSTRPSVVVQAAGTGSSAQGLGSGRRHWPGLGGSVADGKLLAADRESQSVVARVAA